MRIIEVKRYQAICGSDLYETIKQMIDIAKKENVYVHLNFNGVELEAVEWSSPEMIAEFYDKKQKEKVEKYFMIENKQVLAEAEKPHADK
jgi:hypothetical protein